MRQFAVGAEVLISNREERHIIPIFQVLQVGYNLIRGPHAIPLLPPVAEGTTGHTSFCSDHCRGSFFSHGLGKFDPVLHEKVRRVSDEL